MMMMMTIMLMLKIMIMMKGGHHTYIIMENNAPKNRGTPRMKNLNTFSYWGGDTTQNFKH